MYLVSLPMLRLQS